MRLKTSIIRLKQSLNKRFKSDYSYRQRFLGEFTKNEFSRFLKPLSCFNFKLEAVKSCCFLKNAQITASYFDN